MREGWNKYKFKDVATAVKGKLPKNKNEDGVGVPYLTANYLRSNNADFWIENLEGAITAQDGDCLILWDGAGAGDLFSAKNGVVSSTMAVVTTTRSDILREYLTLFVSSKKDYIKETCRGTTVPHVSPDAISNMELAIPPLPEQKRITDLISSVDSYIDALEQQAESARKSRSAVLHAMLSTGGENWTKTSLGEVAELVRGPFGGSLKKEIFVKDGFAVYEQQHAIYGDFSTIRYRISSQKFAEMKRFELTPGDLIMSCSGTMGKVRIVPDGADAGIINQALLKIKPKSNLISEFLFLWMQSQDFIEQIEMNSGGGALQNVSSVKLLKGIKLPLPEINEQKRIVDLISSMDEGISATEKLVGETKQLRLGLLSDLLSGEHEIPESYDRLMGAA
jgi:type I restriction enzyme S subunit